MKYPKEYSQKALKVLEQNYFTQEEGVRNVELLALAAHCINLVAVNSVAEGIPLTFDMVKEVITAPEMKRDTAHN